MELSEFIKETLVGIANGVNLANDTISNSKIFGDAQRRPYFTIDAGNREKTHGYVNFDVGVTVANESGASGGAGIKIAFARIGTDLNSVESSETISRIKFSILPSVHMA